jgi:hypothetical protein
MPRESLVHCQTPGYSRRRSEGKRRRKKYVSLNLVYSYWANLGSYREIGDARAYNDLWMCGAEVAGFLSEWNHPRGTKWVLLSSALGSYGNARPNRGYSPGSVVRGGRLRLPDQHSKGTSCPASYAVPKSKVITRTAVIPDGGKRANNWEMLLLHPPQDVDNRLVLLFEIMRDRLHFLEHPNRWLVGRRLLVQGFILWVVMVRGTLGAILLGWIR